MNEPDELLRWILSGESYASRFPSDAEADVAMEARDAANSETAWMEADAAVQRLLDDTEVPANARNCIEKIAETAFRIAWDASAGHHDLAAQASDDLRLLAEASLVGYRSTILDAMWTVYLSGAFPANLDRT